MGEVVTNFDPKLLALQIQTVLDNPELMEQWKTNCKIAASKENWEVEVQQLNEFYPKVNE